MLDQPVLYDETYAIDLLIGIAFAVVCRRFPYRAWSYRFEQVKHREENSYKLDLKKVWAKYQM